MSDPLLSLVHPPVTTFQDQLKFERRWYRHFRKLEGERAFSSPNLRTWLYACVYRDNIGYEGEGQIRPGDLGKWDLFYPLLQEWRVDKALAAKISQLNLERVERQLEDDRRL